VLKDKSLRGTFIGGRKAGAVSDCLVPMDPWASRGGGVGWGWERNTGEIFCRRNDLAILDWRKVPSSNVDD